MKIVQSGCLLISLAFSTVDLCSLLILSILNSSCENEVMQTALAICAENKMGPYLSPTSFLCAGIMLSQFDNWLFLLFSQRGDDTLVFSKLLFVIKLLGSLMVPIFIIVFLSVSHFVRVGASGSLDLWPKYEYTLFLIVCIWSAFRTIFAIFQWAMLGIVWSRRKIKNSSKI